MNPDILDILRSAVTDVGSWSWWTADFPKLFQVEFGGVQLLPHPPQERKPPAGQLALRFEQPTSVSFLTRAARGGATTVPDDWPERLHRDQMKPPPSLSSGDVFAFDASAVELALKDARRIDTVFGPPPLEALRAAPGVSFVFWAGPLGAVVLADSMKVLTHGGELAPAGIPAAHQAWWDYWREYWRRKDTADPMPRDYACEVTIPARE